MSNDIVEFDCPHCGHTIRTVDRASWNEVVCGQCQQTVERPESVRRIKADADAIPVDDEDDEDLPMLETLQGQAAAQAASMVSPTPLDGEQGDVSDAPLRIEESGLFAHDDVYGVLCHVCDTRVHVRPDQVGTTLECPICFTKITVAPHVPKAKIWGRGGATAPGQNQNKKRLPNPASQESDADPESSEFKLSEPVQRPKIAMDFGLDAGDEDLLAPRPKAAPGMEDQPTVEGVTNDTDSKSPLASAPKRPSAESGRGPSDRRGGSGAKPEPGSPGRSRRERLEEAERRQQRLDEQRNQFRPVRSVEDTGPEPSRDYPEFTQSELISALLRMLTSPGLAWRVAVVTAVMLFGAIAKECILPSGTGMDDFEGASFFLYLFLSHLVGTLPYALGLLGLWTIGGFVFRDAGLGKQQVDSWHVSGSNELLATLSIFGFSFFLSGFLAVFTPYLIMPLRMLVAPLLLIGAWFNNSPWQVASVDVFSNFTRLNRQWRVLYAFLGCLALIGLLAGLLFTLRQHVDTFVLDVLMTVIGVLINVILTLIFAGLAGWHSGSLVNDLERQ